MRTQPTKSESIFELIEDGVVAYNSAKIKLLTIFFTVRSGLILAKSSQACGKRRKILKSRNAALSKYIQLAFSLKKGCKSSTYVKLGVEIWSSCKEVEEHNLVSDIKRDISLTKFDAVLLHSNWSSLRRKCSSKISTDISVYVYVYVYVIGHSSAGLSRTIGKRQ